MLNSKDATQETIDAFSHIVGRISEKYMTELLDVLCDQYKQFFQINDIVKYRKYFIDTITNFLNTTDSTNYDFDTEKLKTIIDLATEEQNSRKTPAKYLDKIINFTKQYIDTTIDFDEYKRAYLTETGTRASNVSKKGYLQQEQDRVYELNQAITNHRITQDTIALFDLAYAFAQEYKKLKNREKSLQNII